MRPETAIIEIHGQYRIHTEFYGNPAAQQTIILVNGSLSTTASFAQTVKYLQPHYNVVLYDQPYAGQSKPHNENHTPTNQVEAFPADWASPLNDPQRPFEHIVFTVPWNMGEQPALSINCGFTAAGMPIGLQLVAPRFADTWLLRIGKTYEGWRGPIHGWPRPPAD